MRRIEAERPGSRPDGVARRRTGLQLRVVHHGLDQEHAACLLPPDGLANRFCRDQSLPREVCRFSGQRLVERCGERAHQRLDVAQPGLAVLHSLQGRLDRCKDTAERGIRRKRREQELGMEKPFYCLLHLARREEQEAVTVEKRPAIGPAHAPKQIGLAGECRSQSRGRKLADFRCRTVDHHDGELLEAMGRPLRMQALFAATRASSRSARPYRRSWRNVAKSRPGPSPSARPRGAARSGDGEHWPRRCGRSTTSACTNSPVRFIAHRSTPKQVR